MGGRAHSHLCPSLSPLPVHAKGRDTLGSTLVCAQTTHTHIHTHAHTHSLSHVHTHTHTHTQNTYTHTHTHKHTHTHTHTRTHTHTQTHTHTHTHTHQSYKSLYQGTDLVRHNALISEYDAHRDTL